MKTVCLTMASTWQTHPAQAGVRIYQPFQAPENSEVLLPGVSSETDQGSTRVPPGFHEVLRGGASTKKSTACCWGYHLSFFFFRSTARSKSEQARVSGICLSRNLSQLFCITRTLPQGRPAPPRSLSGLRPQSFQLLGKKTHTGQSSIRCLPGAMPTPVPSQGAEKEIYSTWVGLTQRKPALGQ